MHFLIYPLIILLPLHALIITSLKCRFEVNTDFLRFWKEFLVLFLLFGVFIKSYHKHDFSLKKIYHKNTLLWLTTIFIASSAFFIYFPFMELKAAAVLGFRYDVFFLLALICWLYAGGIRHIRNYVLALSLITFAILWVFLPWYLFGDISSLTKIFGYSSEVSTYTANSCISFAQNVEGQHRFQGTFGGPIRFSVFLTIVACLFTGWFWSHKNSYTKIQKICIYTLILIPFLTAIFFSYSKTSMLGVAFAGVCMSLLSYKYIYRKKIWRKVYIFVTWIMTIPLMLIALLKWELFLHLWSVLNRMDNLSKSLEMFFYNPFWYGLWIAGPASQIGNSIESAGEWIIATNTVNKVHKFLPENWYVQILLEQWIIGFSIFMALIVLIAYRLFDLVKRKRDIFSISIFSAYLSLCFMALFTHAFEEAATSYILFLFIGIVLAESVTKEQTWSK